MSRIRTSDVHWDRCYASFRYAHKTVLTGAVSDSPHIQFMFGIKAYHAMRSIDASVIYSRSMFPGSHIAAFLYKREHPEVTWYAEFSDPVTYDSKGRNRDELYKKSINRLKEYDGFFEACELAPYDFADKLIFTNSVQRAYMLDKCVNKESANRAKSHSVIWHHPIIDSEYAHISRSTYALDKKTINVGYFGSFYATRGAGDLMNLTTRDDITLHMFVPNPDDVKEYESQNVVINKMRPYLEFLNIASRMDYLFLSDMQPLEGVTPWLPSKLSDYLATGVPIIARCNEGSPMFSFNSDQIKKIDSVSQEFVESLKKSQ